MAKQTVHLRRQGDLVPIEPDDKSWLGATLEEAVEIAEGAGVVRGKDQAVLAAPVSLLDRLAGSVRYRSRLSEESKESKDWALEA